MEMSTFPKEYEIEGLKIVHYDRYETKRCIYECVDYTTCLCKMSIAKDILGIQICSNGKIFNNISFNCMDTAVSYLRINKNKAIKFFRKVYIKSLLTKYYKKGGH